MGEGLKVIAVISDIHANLEALLAVFDHLRQRQIRRIFFLGDIIGYGPNPGEVIDYLKHFEFCLLGNHDLAVLKGAPSYFNAAAQRAVAWTRTQVSPFELKFKFLQNSEYIRRLEAWKFLLELRPARRLGDLYFVHDTPADPGSCGYVRKLEQARAIFAKDPAVKAFFIGHSHIAKRFTEDAAQDPEYGRKYLFKEGRTIVNVGSVGQPRDKDPRACYVIIDDEGYRFFRVEYDVAAAAKKIRAAGLDPILADRLEKGT
ncbi:MAG TPA: metallophosphoesterase family protein [Planctomycetota bacterium]|nr:metallophosphoesterase family protein [Planctomycetota bacterium]